MDLSVFHLNEYHGYSVKFSPFLPQRIGCVASQNYGLSGGGCLFVLDLVDQQLVPIFKMQWADSLFDLAFSEDHPNVVMTASGDGSLQLWNIQNPQTPQKVWKEHCKEISCIDWSQTRQQQHVLSSSWDQTIKLWDPNVNTSLNTYKGHSDLVYSVTWSPLLPNCFASVSGDKTLCIWNSLKPSQPVVKIPVHGTEVLTCDWSRYDRNMIATGGVDGKVKGWDLRNTSSPRLELVGHQYAVKRLKFSPQHAHVLASVSYDFTTRIWDCRRLEPEIFSHHHEFVYGLDFSCLSPNVIADCSWDRTVAVYTPSTLLQLV